MSKKTPPIYPPLPAPSALTFSRDRLPDAPPGIAIRLVLRLRQWLLALADRLTPAEISIFDHSVGAANTAILGAVVKHEIAESLVAGPMNADDIARVRGLDADAVHRALRMLSSMGIFKLRPDGTFANNRMSDALRGGQRSRAREWVLYFSSPSNLAAWGQFSHSLETGKNAFSYVHGRNVWEWFDAHPDEREIFAHAMMGITALDAPAIASLYPFSESDTVCDVGGGRATLLSEILLRHPHLKGILCDGAGVISSARTLLTERGIEERVQLIAGNFFDEVPAGADTYLLKNILHDWDDPTSERILRTVRKAMKPDTKLLVCEMIADRNGDNLVANRSDLQMMTVCQEGRERSVADFEALFANTGFRLSRVFPSPLTAILEAVPVQRD